MTVVNNVTKTLSEMRDMVYFLISEAPTSVIFTSSKVNEALNMGVAQVSKLYERNTSRITSYTAIGVRDYEIPEATFRAGVAVVDSVTVDGNELTPIEPDWENTDDPDTPTSYWVNSGAISVTPTPDAVLPMAVVYRKEQSPLVDDDDTISLPDLCIQAAVFYACYLMKLKDEEYQAADRFKTEYEDVIKRASALQSGVYKAAQVTYGGTA